MVVRMVIDELFGGEAAKVKGFDARFAGVVFPGETLTTDMWDVGGGTIVFTARTDRGEALSSAAATIA